MELNDKTAVITGGASGIGLATAIQFSKAGAKIVLGDIEDGPLAEQVKEMRSHGATVIGVHCDVAQESDVEALRDAALKEFGAVHVVFNNAGVAGGATCFGAGRLVARRAAVFAERHIHAVYEEVVPEARRAVEFHTATLAGGRIRRSVHAGLQADELREITAVQGERLDFGVIDHDAQVRSGGIDQGRR